MGVDPSDALANKIAKQEAEKEQTHQQAVLDEEQASMITRHEVILEKKRQKMLKAGKTKKEIEQEEKERAAEAA